MKIAILGLGRMGELHFLNALKMKDVKVVAVADKKKELQIAKSFQVKFYNDYEKLLDSEDLDAVVISLPNYLKKESIIYSAEKGLDIFVDKPLARNYDEANLIVQKVKAQNTKLMVGANYRYFDSVQKLKNSINEGRIGDVVIANSELIMDGPFSHSLVPKPVPDWWFDKEKSGGGALLDLGFHLVDIMSWIFGDLVVEFCTLGYRFSLPVEDSATVVFKAPKTGARCVVNVGWFSKMIFPKFNFRINLHGTVGFASTDHFAPRNPYFYAFKEGASNFFRRISGKRLRYLSYTYYYASFADILEDFFETIKEDKEAPITLEEQLTVSKVLDNAYKFGMT